MQGMAVFSQYCLEIPSLPALPLLPPFITAALLLQWLAGKTRLLNYEQNPRSRY